MNTDNTQQLCPPSFDPWDIDLTPPQYNPYPFPVKQVFTSPVTPEVYVARDIERIELPYSSVSEQSIPAELKDFMLQADKYGRTILAGGYIRDLCLNTSPNDIDLFTSMSFDAAVRLLSTSEHIEQGTVLQVNNTGVKGPVYSEGVQYLLQFYLKELDEPVQLIGVMDSPHVYIRSMFCVGTSRVSYHPRYGFSYTWSFISDMQSERITVMNADTLTDAYLRKLRAYMPEREIRV